MINISKLWKNPINPCSHENNGTKQDFEQAIQTNISYYRY